MGRPSQVSQRSSHHDPLQLGRAIGQVDPFQIGPNFSNHDLAGGEAEGGHALQPRQTGQPLLDDLRVLLGFCHVSFQPVRSHDEVCVYRQDLLLKLMFEAAGHGKDHHQRRNPQDNTHRRHRGEHGKHLQQDEQEHGQGRHQRQDHPRGFQAARVAA